MKRTAVCVATMAGLLMVWVAPAASAQTGPLFFCGYPVQLCAPGTPAFDSFGVPIPGAVPLQGAVPAQGGAAAQQQQQQQQQLVVVSTGGGDKAAAPGSSSSSAAAAGSPAGRTGTGGGKVAFTGANVLRWAMAALAMMSVGLLLLLNSRSRTRSAFAR